MLISDTPNRPAQLVHFLGGHMAVSENHVALKPMVLLIIIPIKWLSLGRLTLFSDKPTWRFPFCRGFRPQCHPWIQGWHQWILRARLGETSPNASFFLHGNQGGVPATESRLGIWMYLDTLW